MALRWTRQRPHSRRGDTDALTLAPAMTRGDLLSRSERPHARDDRKPSLPGGQATRTARKHSRHGDWDARRASHLSPTEVTVSSSGGDPSRTGDFSWATHGRVRRHQVPSSTTSGHASRNEGHARAREDHARATRGHGTSSDLHRRATQVPLSRSELRCSRTRGLLSSCHELHRRSCEERTSSQCDYWQLLLKLTSQPQVWSDLQHPVW